MCKLNKKEFFSAKRCREELLELLRSNEDVARIHDKILSKYSKNTVEIVLASTVLTEPSIGYSYSESNEKWATKYVKKIGFLKENISLKSHNLKTESFLEILRRNNV